jgi:hypothetical protein
MIINEEDHQQRLFLIKSVFTPFLLVAPLLKVFSPENPSIDVEIPSSQI